MKINLETALMLIGEDETMLIDIIDRFGKQLIAQSKSPKIYDKDALWIILNEREFKCLDIVIQAKDENLYLSMIPNKLGDFVKNICGNSLQMAIWILQVQSTRYCKIYETESYVKIIEVLFLLKGLLIFINNSLQNPDKHFTEIYSTHEGWKHIYHHYLCRRKSQQIHWCIQGQFRFKGLPYPKGKLLKKELLNGRCMLCYNHQLDNTYFCANHSSDSLATPENKKIKRWIRDSYKYLRGNEAKVEDGTVDIFVMSYELHSWAKWHPAHKAFKDSIMTELNHLFSMDNSLNYKSSIRHIQKKIEYLCKLHPYIDEFECAVDISSGEILEVLYSLILQSEHTIIKIAASKRLRLKYEFNPNISKGWFTEEKGFIKGQGTLSWINKLV